MRLGYPHPDHLLDDLSSEQLAEWEAFNRIQPVGDWRQDFQFGMVSSLITNFVRLIYKRKGSHPKLTDALDFIPNWGGGSKPDEVQVQSTEEQKNILLQFVRSHNKTQKGKSKNPSKKRNKK